MARSFIYKSKDTVRASKMLNTELNAGTQINWHSTRCELIEGSGKGLGSSPPELTLQHLPQGAIWHSGGKASPTPMAKRIGTRLPCTNLLRRVARPNPRAMLKISKPIENECNSVFFLAMWPQCSVARSLMYKTKYKLAVTDREIH